MVDSAGNLAGGNLGAGVSAWLQTPSSANLIAAVTDETGTGALVFANTPTLVTPLLGTPTSGVLTNCTGLPTTALTVGDFNGLGIYEFTAVIVAESTTSRTTTDADSGKIIESTNAGATAITLHATASVGVNISFTQATAGGQMTFASTGSGAVRNASTQFKTRTQWSGVNAYVRSNAGGSAAEWVLTGDTAA
jgi:hypothetical protein